MAKAIVKYRGEDRAWPYELKDVAAPPPLRTNEVLVKTLFAGICATDLAYLTGASDPRQLENVTPVEDHTVALHEAVGLVVESNGTPLENGTLVVPLVRRCEQYDEGQFVPCRFTTECPVMGQPERCPRPSTAVSRGTGKCSGFGSELFVDNYQWLIPVRDDLVQRVRQNIQFFSLAEPMAVAHRGVRLANGLRNVMFAPPFPARDKVLVVGLGPIGFLAALSLVSFYGYRNVWGVDVYDKNNIRARLFEDTQEHGLGMQGKYINFRDYAPSDGLSYAQWLKEKTEVEGFQIIIEASGRPESISQLVPALAPGGALVALSFPEGAQQLNVEQTLDSVETLLNDVGGAAGGAVPQSVSLQSLRDEIQALRRSVVIPPRDFMDFVVQNKVVAGCVNLGRQDMLDAVELLAAAYEDRASFLYRLVHNLELPYSPDIATELTTDTPRREKNIKTVIDFAALADDGFHTPQLADLRALVIQQRYTEISGLRDMIKSELELSGASYANLSPVLHLEMAAALVRAGEHQKANEEIEDAIEHRRYRVVQGHKSLLQLMNTFDELDTEKADIVTVMKSPIQMLSRRFEGDPEHYGLAGRYFRKLWELSHCTDDDLFQTSLQRYKYAYVVHKDSYYCLGNVANLHLHAASITGDRHAQREANTAYGDVKLLCERLQDEGRDDSHWLHFTWGDACFVLDEIEEAKKHYDIAIPKIPAENPREVTVSATKGLNRIKAGCSEAAQQAMEAVIKKLAKVGTLNA